MSAPANRMVDSLAAGEFGVGANGTFFGLSARTRTEAWARQRERNAWLVITGQAGFVWLAVYGQFASQRSSLFAAIGASFLVAAVWLVSMYGASAGWTRLALATGEAGATFLGVLAGAVAVSALGLWLPGLDLTPLHVLVMAGAIFVLCAAWNALVARDVARGQRMLIVGGGESSRELVGILRATGSPFDPVGIVDDDLDSEILAGVPVRGQIDQLPLIVEMERPDLVVLCIDRNRPAVFKELLEVAGAGFKVVGLPEFYEHAFGRVPVRHVTPAWFMSVLHLYQRPYARITKRTFDLVVALIGLVLNAPSFLLIATAVATTRGPVIFRQQRIGQGGRLFTMYKFRTMRVDAEGEGAAWAQKEDPRITGVGRILRRTRLDELPQLWNVVKGDMSIVGPRPERPEFAALLEEAVPFWTRRQLLKPGITGWAQLCNGYSADTLGTEAKLSYDLWYLRHRSLLLDLIICTKTLPKLFSGAGAR